jgi:carboxyl-terminal processing protease
MRLKSHRPFLAVTLFVLLTSMIVGTVLGSQARPTAATTQDVDTPLKNFTTILGLVEENHSDPVDTDKAVYGAIEGMLRTLDPHSKFLDPKAFAAMREDQRGRYYGLGIMVGTRFGRVTIVSPPFPGSPAEKVGLRVADVIGAVNGESTVGMGQNDVVARIRGPRGTTVKLSVERPGVDKPIQMTPMRDEIARSSISDAFMIRNGVGYIKLDSFAETTGAELRDALRQLDAKSLNGLIFDLRGNPGGLLPQAIEVSETFLQKGQLILETRGRTRGSSNRYQSQRTNNDTFPLVILINGQSASASEIVAGAVQDHDRGLVVGQTSFGKGLVQSIFQLNKNAGLTLTTQKWYTPSGRLIQRDYSEISQFDYYNHREGTAPKKEDVKSSGLGRVLYGGGGITPDYVVEDTPSNAFQDLLAGNLAYYTFVRDFLVAHPAVDRSFEVSDSFLSDFKQHLAKRGIRFRDSDFEAHRDHVSRMLRYEIFYHKFGVPEATRILLDIDPQVLKALEIFPEARDLYAKARRQVANGR